VTVGTIVGIANELTRYLAAMSPLEPTALETLLDASSAHPAFKADVLDYAARRPVERLVIRGVAPRIKVLRVVSQLLHEQPGLRIESVSVHATAGCADFRGEIAVIADGVERVWDFLWDCRWRAREAGHLDRYGYPDQARAAREFGWRCFALWRERTAAPSMSREHYGLPSTTPL
jgi:hypothetical protein